MKNKLLLLSTILYTFTLNAQLTDNMESYTDGSMIFQGHWSDWNANGSHAIYASSIHSASGSLSAYVPPNGTTDAILDLGNKTSGQWGLKFMMYIPSNKEAQMNIQGTVPVNSGDWVVGNIYFNRDNNSPGTGYVNYQTNSSSNWSYFNFPHDEWFEVIINIHLNNNWQLLINGNVEIDWTPYGKWVGDGQFEYSNLLGGINFFSSSSTCEYWIDDIDFISGFQTSSVSVAELSMNKNFLLYPNPTRGILYLKQSNQHFSADRIRIYSVLGELLLQKNIVRHSIDLSSFKKGIYIIEILDDNTHKSDLQKIIIE